MFKHLTIKKLISLGCFIAAVGLSIYEPSAITIIGMFLGSAMGFTSFKDLLPDKEDKEK